MSKQNTWVCINCGTSLGTLMGQELCPDKSADVMTQGANLLVTCAQCGSRKIWYPADPLVRVLVQLIDVIATQTAKSAIRSVYAELSQLRQAESKSIGGDNE